MKKIALIFILCLLMIISGCSNNAPSTEPEIIDNNQGAFENEDNQILNDLDDLEEENDQDVSDIVTQDEVNSTYTKPAEQINTANNTSTSNSTQATSTNAKQSDTQSASVDKPISAPAPLIEPEPVYKYKDGTYTGYGWGYESDIVVSVTLKSDVMTDIKLVSHSDDDIYMQDAVKVINLALTAQSADVNAVSGATASSAGIKDAIKNALAKAIN